LSTPATANCSTVSADGSSVAAMSSETMSSEAIFDDGWLIEIFVRAIFASDKIAKGEGGTSANPVYALGNKLTLRLSRLAHQFPIAPIL